MFPIILVGGSGRNTKQVPEEIEIAYHAEYSTGNLSSNTAPGAKAIVVLARWCSHSVRNRARSIAQSRGIPIIQTSSMSRVVGELKKRNLISEAKEASNGNGKHHEDAATATPPQAQPRQEKSDQGLGADQLWPLYRQPLKDFFACCKPGEKFCAEDLVNTMNEITGISKGDLQELLPEAASQGYIFEFPGDVWVVPDEDGYAEEPGLPASPSRQPQQKGASTKDDAAISLGGIPGTYSTKTDIYKRAIQFYEFFRGESAMSKHHFTYRILPRALSAEIIQEVPAENGKVAYRIQGDPSVRLTPISLETSVLKAAIGEIKPTEIPLSNIARLRAMLPQSQWDSLAKEAINERLKSSGRSPVKSVSASEFSKEQWDLLAFEALSPKPVKTIAYGLRGFYEDRIMTCWECRKQFRLTVSEQEFLWEKFGTVMPPKRCVACRKMERERKEAAHWQNPESL